MVDMVALLLFVVIENVTACPLTGLFELSVTFAVMMVFSPASREVASAFMVMLLPVGSPVLVITIAFVVPAPLAWTVSWSVKVGNNAPAV
jgi:hypothetical protein